MMILWVVLIIALIYFLGRGNGYFGSHHNNHRPYSSDHPNDRAKFSDKDHRMNNQNEFRSDMNEDQALEIAKQRYASGEITKKEFEEIKKNLEQ